MSNPKPNANSEVKAGCILLTLVVAIGAAFAFGIPAYRVWTAGMSGTAKLRHAEQEKRVMIEQAKAEVEAARLRAEAIELIGEAAQRYPEYRNQEFIGAFAEALNRGNVQQIIYVPTEASIPIIEARDRR